MTGFERQSLAFHQRVRAGYLAIARKAPVASRWCAPTSPSRKLQGQIRALIDRFLRKTSRNSKSKLKIVTQVSNFD